MKTHKLSILGGITGAIIILSSIVRWFFLFYDPSQLVFGVGVGVTISIFAYIYNWMKNQEEENKKINKRLDAFTDWWIKKEME
jgi:hypothetical protein